ncbi:M20/M25/M40 family metallo-hydrolase [Ancylomarina sp. DW003]|nr:M20/M25/M40 family metallo-hydrolase [Ancylomarina sp. DW003]MDE5421069.1 M20/M25/M40 family metallo-hydrolase [Ancylomarina sp. DW003]
MKVAIIYNKDFEGVINIFGMQNKEVYSPATVQKVVDALEKGGHNVAVIDGNMHVVERLQNFMPKVVDGEQMGMVFNMAYGIQGESRYTHIPSMLEMLGIPYVGSSPSGHALALDKVITKIMWQKHGISTPDFWVFNSANDDMSNVKYPVIVKPKMESVSFGLKVVYNEEDLRESVNFIVKEFQQQALAEQFIRGREFCVGILGNEPVETFPILEIDLNNDPDAIQTVTDKKEAPKRKICPADLPKEVTNEMVRQSIEAFKALQLRDFARVDIRMDENNNIYLLEINSMASLGFTGSYPAAAKVSGYDYDDLVNKMLDVASVRYFSGSILNQSSQKPKKPLLHTRIRGFLRGRQPQHLKMLQKIVNMNSHVRDIDGVNQLGNYLKGQFATLGFVQENYPQIEVGNHLFFTNSYDNEYDVLLLGVLDNSTPLSKHESYNEQDQKIYGTGVWEHKGGLIVAMAALQALKYSRNLKNYKIGILLTTDNSVFGKFSRRVVKEKAAKSKVVIGLHGANSEGSLTTSRSGSAKYTCQMNLLPSERSEKVANAASAFNKMVQTWCDLSVDDDSLVIAPQEMRLNTNIMQSYCNGSVKLNIRFNQIDQFKTLDESIKKAVPSRKLNKIAKLQMEGGIMRPPLEENKKTDQFFQFIQPIAKKLDIRVAKEHRWDSSDICSIDTGMYLIDGFGPSGQINPKQSEFIYTHSISERSLLLAMTIHELYNKNFEI